MHVWFVPHPSELTFHLGDILALDFPDDDFDAVIEQVLAAPSLPALNLGAIWCTLGCHRSLAGVGCPRPIVHCLLLLVTGCGCQATLLYFQETKNQRDANKMLAETWRVLRPAAVCPQVLCGPIPRGCSAGPMACRSHARSLIRPPSTAVSWSMLVASGAHWVHELPPVLPSAFATAAAAFLTAQARWVVHHRGRFAAR